MSNQRLMSFLAYYTNKISPKLCFSLQYFHRRKRFPDLDNPKDFSEVILSQMVSGKINEFTDLADKIKMRDYVERWGYSQYLPQIFGVWDNAQDITFDAAPSRFIVKTNHGSGGHRIVRDKDTADINEIKVHFAKSLKKKYSSLETQYNNIKPLVYLEEFIDDGNSFPTDYKFMCLDGQVKAILVCFDRGNEVHKATYDENWQKIDYIEGATQTSQNVNKPENLDKMLEIARSISSHFEQVRVDLYNAYGKIYIGELTFTADGGVLRNFTDEAIKKMGRQ